MTSGHESAPESDVEARSSDIGLFLHASSVVVAGEAWLFLGHSTAGKSTLARLLAESAQVLADDSVFATRAAEGFWQVVDGSFRFGRDEVPGWEAEIRRRAAQGSVRVGGCFRIHKAAETRAEPMPPLETARHLMDAAMEIDRQRKFGRPREGEGGASTARTVTEQMRRQWFRQVAEIARTCPGWNLWFSKDANGAEAVEKLSNLMKERISSPF